MNDWGYTNDPRRIEVAQKFIENAINDGWCQEQTYPCESIDRACKLKRDGFLISAITRTNVGKWKYQVSLHGWAPDQLCIRLPEVYDYNVITEQQFVCTICSKPVEETFRYSFAGRSCSGCLDKAREQHEQHGWCD